MEINLKNIQTPSHKQLTLSYMSHLLPLRFMYFDVLVFLLRWSPNLPLLLWPRVFSINFAVDYFEEVLRDPLPANLQNSRADVDLPLLSLRSVIHIILHLSILSHMALVDSGTSSIYWRTRHQPITYEIWHKTAPWVVGFSSICPWCKPVNDRMIQVCFVWIMLGYVVVVWGVGRECMWKSRERFHKAWE